MKKTAALLLSTIMLLSVALTSCSMGGIFDDDKEILDEKNKNNSTSKEDRPPTAEGPSNEHRYPIDEYEREEFETNEGVRDETEEWGDEQWPSIEDYPAEDNPAEDNTDSSVDQQLQVCDEQGIVYKLYNGTQYSVVGITNTARRDIIIPSTLNNLPVTRIDDSAFYGCTSLTSITIPGSVTSIDDGAFRGCTSLKAVYITDIAKWCSISFGNNYANPLYYAGNLYLNGTLVTDLVIPADVTSIGAYAFYMCTSLESITISENVTSIGNLAFYYCYNLLEVYNLSSLDIKTFDDSNGFIGRYALGVYSSTDIPSRVYTTDDDYVFFADTNNVYLVGYIGTDTQLTLPDNYNGRKYSIKSYAFKDRAELISVTIPDGIKEIGNYTFSGCSGLTSITIPESVTSLGSHAFSCVNLTEINFNAIAMGDNPDNSSAFWSIGQNSKGVTVNIGANVTKIPNNLFSGASYRDQNYTEKYMYNKITNVVFADGSQCKSIGASAFEGCKDLVNISLPKGITHIDKNAFYNCESLTSITIPENITSIGNYAFRNCTALAEINFNATSMDDLTSENRMFYNAGQNSDGITVNVGANVTKIPAYIFYAYEYDNTLPPKVINIVFADKSQCTSIGERAFTNSESLISITIPNSITSVGYYAFAGCTDLTEINFNATAMDDLSSENYVFSGAGQNGGGITVNVGANVTKIPAYMFYNVSCITNVLFTNESQCTSIGESAFSGCIGLISMEIPMNIINIYDNAFLYCYKLVEICNLSCLEITNENGSNGYIGNYALNIYSPNNGESKLRTINDEYVFYVDGSTVYVVGYTGTDKQLILPNDYNGHGYEIYSYAFYNRDILTSITISSDVTGIGKQAFSSCSSLIEINFNATAMDDLSDSPFEYAGNYSDGITVNIGANVTKIPAHLFDNCDDITSVIFVNNSQCKSIGSYAFYSCYSLECITIPNGVTSIGYEAFEYCGNLVTISIPDSITDVGNYAFSGCPSLSYNEYDNGYYLGNENNKYLVLVKAKSTDITSCRIHTDTKVIADRAFEYCTSLTSITIPDSVTSIGNYAFDDCTSLENVTIGNSITSIGGSAFSGCTSLKNVTIPNSVTSIGDGAFYNCTSLVYNEYDNGYYLGNENNKYLVLVKAKSTDITSFQIHTNTRFIHSYAFDGCTSLRSITIPDSVESIGSSAFSHCTSLESITIPDKVTSIGDYAFDGCKSLETITIPNSVTSIGDDAFRGCTSLKSITIPDSVTSIGDYAFDGCTSLESITIPDSVTSIGSSAFNRCTSLESIIVGSGNTKYHSAGNCLIETSTKTLISGCKNSVIPTDGSVTSIGDYAFYYCTILTSITIPNSVTSIGDYAFSYCISLTSITIPDSVMCIGIDAFYNCKSLKSITIPDSVTSIDDYAFNGCTSLESITIPNSVTSIGSSAFKDCTSLTSITFADTTTWYITTSSTGWSSMTGGTEVDVTNPSTNATYFTDTYEGYYWYKL